LSLWEILFYFFWIVTGNTHAIETTKSHGTHPHSKTPAHADTHGKTGIHPTTKKSDVHKSRTTKHDPEKDDHTGIVVFFLDQIFIPLWLLSIYFFIETDDAIATAVSENSDNISHDKPDTEDENQSWYDSNKRFSTIDFILTIMYKYKRFFCCCSMYLHK
jgi:hypothetical protein